MKHTAHAIILMSCVLALSGCEKKQNVQIPEAPVQVIELSEQNFDNMKPFKYTINTDRISVENIEILISVSQFAKGCSVFSDIYEPG